MRPVEKSRQHFLKLKMPQTYQRLIENDITEDCTMGYSSQVGFRAGLCSPFYFYDLEKEIKTGLKIFPFQVMDATLIYYLHKNPQEATQVIFSLIEKVKSCNGTFSTLWHNSSFSEQQEWVGWTDFYKSIFKKALP